MERIKEKIILRPAVGYIFHCFAIFCSVLSFCDAVYLNDSSVFFFNIFWIVGLR